jgi:hypothetical protein
VALPQPTAETATKFLRLTLMDRERRRRELEAQLAWLRAVAGDCQSDITKHNLREIEARILHELEELKKHPD